MNKYEKLTRKELIELLEKLQKSLKNIDKLERTLHELEVYKIEMEMKNRELVETRQKLENSLNDYADLYDFAPVGYLTCDGKGVIRKINLTGAKMLGMENFRLIDVPFIYFVVKSDVKKFLSHLQICRKNTEQTVTELKIKKEGGGEFYILLTSEPERYGDSSVLFYRSIMTDITSRKQIENKSREYRDYLKKIVKERTEHLNKTNKNLEEEINERKNTEKALKESDSNFRNLFREYYTLLEGTPGFLLVISPEKRVLWANNIATSEFGKENIQSKTICKLFECIEPCSCPSMESFSSGKREKGQIKNKYNRYFDVYGSPVKDKTGKVIKVIMMANDITEKKLLEKEAIRTSHLALIGELAAGVAHEINNPVNTVINCAQILMDNPEKDTRELIFVKSLMEQAERISYIVSKLLSFARRGVEEKIPVYLNEIFSSVMSLTGSQLEENFIKLRENISQTSLKIMAHSIQIQQVFMNILLNAKYGLNKKYPGPHENKILEIYAEEVHVSGKPFARIIFKDYGNGISDDIIDKVMNPFFTTKPVGEGTGLGLSICYGIVKEHKGNLLINSVAGEFTEVIIELLLCSQ